MRKRTSTMTAAVVAIAMAAITGCTGAAPAAPPPSPSPSAAGSTPSLQTLDAETITQAFESAAEELGQPGAAMLLITPQGEFTATYGTTTFGGSTPVSLDDHIRIGSNTKTWTGTVILQLVQEGKIALDDPVSKYRPDVPGGDGITIEQMLTMRSGLANYTATYELNKALDDDPQRVWQPEELVAMGLALPPVFAPGEGWYYSNTNTILLGLIAEKLDGKPLEQIFQDRLLTPLGLTETSFPALADSSLPVPYAEGYHWWTNVGTLSNSALPPDLLQEADAGTFAPTNSALDNPSWAWSAGSGISTLRDLATWVQALAGDGGDLLDPALQQERLDSVRPVVVPTLPEPQYGLGIAKFGPMYGHTGELPGYNSFMGYDPVNDVTLVVWATSAPAPDGSAPASTIAVDLMDQNIYARSVWPDESSS
jgi:D-alanyl-D-alanine carboxypeptidase